MRIRDPLAPIIPGGRLAPGATHRVPIFSPNNLPGGIPAILLVKKTHFYFSAFYPKKCKSSEKGHHQKW